MKRIKFSWTTIFAILVIICLAFLLIAVLHTGFFEQEHLFFTVNNEDVHPHQVVIEIFDSSGILIFTDKYSLDPGQFIKSSSVIDETDDGDIYMYKATLENNRTSIYNFTVDSNAAASIHIYNDSENAEAYIDFGYTIE